MSKVKTQGHNQTKCGQKSTLTKGHAFRRVRDRYKFSGESIPVDGQSSFVCHAAALGLSESCLHMRTDVQLVAKRA